MLFKDVVDMKHFLVLTSALEHICFVVGSGAEFCERRRGASAEAFLQKVFAAPKKSKTALGPTPLPLQALFG
jgi:hypothetical protein